MSIWNWKVHGLEMSHPPVNESRARHIHGGFTDNAEKIAYLQDMISFGWSIWREALNSWWVKHNREITDFHRQLRVLLLYSLPKQSHTITVSYIEKVTYLQDTISFGYISSLNGIERFMHWKCHIHLQMSHGQGTFTANSWARQKRLRISGTWFQLGDRFEGRH